MVTKRGADRIAKTFRLEASRVAVLERLHKTLVPRTSLTALVEQGIDLLVAHYARQLKDGKRRG